MKTRQITLGLLVIVAGIVLLLSNTNIEPVRSWLSTWWPLFVIAFGLYTFWGDPRNYAWPLFIVTVGALILARTLGIADINIGTVIVPLLLFVVGVSILTASISKRPGAHMTHDAEEHITALLGGSTTKNTSKAYTGGSVTAILGGVELDLRDAVIQDGAVLRVTVVMGGIELRLPENVTLHKRTQSILGGVEDKSAPVSSKSTPVLFIEGPVVMGGVDIKR